MVSAQDDAHRLAQRRGLGAAEGGAVRALLPHRDAQPGGHGHVPGEPQRLFGKPEQTNPIALGPQDKDGNPWTPPTGEVGLLHADNPNKKGDPHGGFMGATDPDQPEEKGPTGFLPLDDPGRLLSRYDVPENLWKYWVGRPHPPMCARSGSTLLLLAGTGDERRSGGGEALSFELAKKGSGRKMREVK